MRPSLFQGGSCIDYESIIYKTIQVRPRIIIIIIPCLTVWMEYLESYTCMFIVITTHYMYVTFYSVSTLQNVTLTKEKPFTDYDNKISNAI